MAFGDKVMIYDRLSGIPGFNSIMRDKLLEMIRSYAKNRQYFSNATYAIIEKLIQDKKIGVFFTPTLRTTKFFTTNNPINVVGGYNFNKHNIEITVKWSFGIDAAMDFMRPTMYTACKKIFALILSEALLLYDYRTNGQLSSRELIQKWYFTYFRSVLGDSLHRFQMADKLAQKICVDYGPRMYTKIEKPIIEGRSPAVIVKKTGANEDLDIEGIPSVVKGDKQLRDIFVDAIEDFAVINRDEYNVDNYAFKDIKAFTDEFGQFGEFLYKNRDLNLLPERISEMPSDPTTPFEKRMASASRARQYELNREADKELDRTYEKYLADNPELQKAIKVADEQRKASYYTKSTERLEKVNEKNEELKAHDEAHRKMLTSFDDEEGGSYVKKMFLDTMGDKNSPKPTLDEIADIPRGLLAVYERKNELEKQIAEANNNGLAVSDPEAFKGLIELYGTVAQNANQTLDDSIKYFREITKYSPDENIKDQFDKLNVNLNTITQQQVQQYVNTMKLAIQKSREADETNAARQIHLPDTHIANSRTYNRLVGEYKTAKDQIDNFNARIESAQDNTTKAFLMQQKKDVLDRVATDIRNHIDPQIYGALTNNQISGIKNVEFITRFEKNIQDDIEKIFENPAQFNVSRIVASRPDINNADDIFKRVCQAVKTSSDATNQRLVYGKGYPERIKNAIDSFENTFMTATGNPSYEAFNKAAEQYKNDHNLVSIDAAKNELLKNIIQTTGSKGYSIGQAYNIAHHLTLSQAKKELGLQRTASFDDTVNAAKAKISSQVGLYNQNTLRSLTAILKSHGYKENATDPKDMEKNLAILKNILDVQYRNNPAHQNSVLYGYERDIEKGNAARLQDKIKTQERAYRRQLYLDGYDWMYSRMPKWSDVKRWFKQGVNMAEDTVRAMRGLYRLAKIIYPSKANIELYANQPMGFEIMGHVGYFDLAYKINCGIKRMYELNKGTVRRDLVYDEIYMPVSILQKMLFAQINTLNEYSPETLFLIDCANKGLELMM